MLISLGVRRSEFAESPAEAGPLQAAASNTIEEMKSTLLRSHLDEPHMAALRTRSGSRPLRQHFRLLWSPGLTAYSRSSGSRTSGFRRRSAQISRNNAWLAASLLPNSNPV
jgi:hypothetical protein